MHNAHIVQYLFLATEQDGTWYHTSLLWYHSIYVYPQVTICFKWWLQYNNPHQRLHDGTRGCWPRPFPRPSWTCWRLSWHCCCYESSSSAWLDISVYILTGLEKSVYILTGLVKLVYILTGLEISVYILKGGPPHLIHPQRGSNQTCSCFPSAERKIQYDFFKVGLEIHFKVSRSSLHLFVVSAGQTSSGKWYRKGTNKYLSNSGLEDFVEVGMVPEEGPVHCHHHLPAKSIFGSFWALIFQQLYTGQ